MPLHGDAFAGYHRTEAAFVNLGFQWVRGTDGPIRSLTSVGIAVYPGRYPICRSVGSYRNQQRDRNSAEYGDRVCVQRTPDGRYLDPVEWLFE